MLSKILILVGLIGSIGVAVIMTTLTPSEAGPTGILTLFISIYAVVLSATTFLIMYINKLIRQLPLGSVSKRMLAIDVRRAYYYSSVLALGPVLIIGMQSVSGVGIYEVGLVVTLIVLGCIYVARKLP